MDFVICPISGTRFSFVRSENETELDALREWAHDLVNRMDGGQRPIIALDCEGIRLGESANSGYCIQLGEVFGECRQGRGRNVQVPTLNPKPGIIAFWPLSEPMKELLTSVLSHRNINIATFDFTSDLAVIMDEGVSVNTRQVIDCQLVWKNNDDLLRSTKVPGLARVIQEAKSNDPFVARAKTASMKGSIDWDARGFLMCEMGISMGVFADKHFMEYAAADVILTGIAMLECMSMPWYPEIVKRTDIKINLVNECSGNEKGRYWHAALERQLAFFNKYGRKKYETTPDVLSTDDDLRLALCNWDKSKMIMEGERETGKVLIEGMESEQHIAIYDKMVNTLKEHIPRIRELAGLNS